MSGNIYLEAAATAWILAQLIKLITDFAETKKLHIGIMVAAGGMPSSHTAAVLALCTTVGVLNGFGTPMFACCMVFATIVMYDAAGVRRAAGNQAAAINKIAKQFEAHGLTLDKKLVEVLGHSPIEVLAGAIMGVGVGGVFILLHG